MARLVAAFASSHSIMLACTRADWQTGFREVDPRNPHYYDRAGRKTDYAALLAAAPADAEAMVTPERMGERFDATQAAMDELRSRIAAARLDALVIVGDDQNELFRLSNTPAIAIYWGRTIRNARAEPQPADNWYQRARLWRQEPDADRDHPVAHELAHWLIRQLADRDFDIGSMNGLEPGQFEGHAFSFIHRRYLEGQALPVLPVIVNTFDPPNQPTPRRCVALGRAIGELIEAWPQNQRIGILASGGLSHFVVDEALDLGVLGALRRHDLDWLAALDPLQLQAGSSEIRNWIVTAGAIGDRLTMDWERYIPGYRTPALTGTGLAFAAWSARS